MFVCSVLPFLFRHTNTRDDTMLSPLTQSLTLLNWYADHFSLLPFLAGFLVLVFVALSGWCGVFGCLFCDES